MRSMYPRHGRNPKPEGRCGRQGVPCFEASVPVCQAMESSFPCISFWNKTHPYKLQGMRLLNGVFQLHDQGHTGTGKHRNTSVYIIATHTNTPHTSTHSHVTRSHPHALALTQAQTLILTRSDPQPTTPIHTLSSHSPTSTHTPLSGSPYSPGPGEST